MRFGNLLVGWLFGTLWNFKKNRRKLFKRGLAGIIIIVIINIVVSCYYYQVSTSYQPSSEKLLQLSDLDKGFVVHQEYNAYFVSSISFNKDSIELHLGASYYESGNDIVQNSPNSVKRYRPKKGDARLLNEVHLYLNQNVHQSTKIWKVAHSDIERLDIYNHSTKHTTSYSILFGIALIPAAYLALVLLFLLIMLLSGNSCPFIYTYNGQDFVFAGEIYSGAVYPPPGTTRLSFTFRTGSGRRNLQNEDFQPA